MTDLETDLITFHGWGFSADIWSDWDSVVPDLVTIRHANRGYFGERKVPVFKKSSEQKVLMTHSFGLHWCPDELLFLADHLVIFSGFLSFHPKQAKHARRSKLMLQQMMSRFVDKPKEVLDKFYEEAFKPSPASVTSPSEINHDILLDDLARLGSVQMRPELLHNIPAITIIHGEEDCVVQRVKAHELFSIFKSKSQYFEIKHSGHAVPFTRHTQCAGFLKPLFRMMVREGSHYP